MGGLKYRPPVLFSPLWLAKRGKNATRIMARDGRKAAELAQVYITKRKKKEGKNSGIRT